MKSETEEQDRSFGAWCEALAFVMDVVVADESPEEQHRALDVMQKLNPSKDDEP